MQHTIVVAYVVQICVSVGFNYYTVVGIKRK